MLTGHDIGYACIVIDAFFRHATQLQKLKEECENRGISFDSMKRLLESEKVKKLQKNTLNADIQSKKYDIKEQEKIKEDIDELKRDFNSTISFIDKNISKIEVKLAGTITCPNCSHEFLLDEDINLDELRNEVKELTFKKEEQSKSLKETKDLELDILKTIDLINKNLNSLKLKEEENESAIRKLRYKLNTVDENISSIKGDMLSLQQSKKHLKEKNVQIEESISFLKEQIKQVKNKDIDDSIIKGLQNNLHDYKQSLKNIEEEIQQKQDELFEIRQWETNFKRFKSYLAQKSLLTIQAKINEQLKLIKSDLRIKLEGFKEKADGTLKEEITPLIIDNGEIVEFSALSGGERVRVDFATILVLQEIINSTHPYGGLNLLFVDEITEGCDPLGLKLLMKSMPKNKSIFVITHISMDSMYENILTIENNNGISIIRQ
jgi:DNA repair exonuclease SbcCD ATPase subunit